MAQIGNIYQTETTDQTHTGDLNYTTKFTVDGAEFEGSTEYLLMLTAQVGGNLANNLFKFRTRIGSTTPEGSEMILEPSTGASTSRHPYVFLHKFTTAATPDDITFQIAPIDDTSHIARADTITLWAIKLDDLASTDWFYGEDTTDIDHTTGSTWQDQASIVFTPDVASEDWLIIAWGSVHINNIAKSWRYRINFDADTSLEPLHSQEGEDLTDEWPWMLMRPYNLDGTEHTFTVQSNDNSSLDAENQHNISKIFALRLQAFEDVVTSWDGGTFNTPDTNFNELVDLAFTPTTTGKGVVLGTCVADTLSAGGAFVRAQIGGVTEPVGKDSNIDTIGYDDSDFSSMPIISQFNVTASTLVDIDIDVRVLNATMDIVDSGFVAFSLELAAASVYNPAESLDVGTTTSSADLHRNRITNPASLIGDISDTLDLQVESNLDDVRIADAAFSDSDGRYWAGRASGGEIIHSAARFTGAGSINSGDTIDVAYLTLAVQTGSSGTVVRTELLAENADAPGQITDTADFNGRSLTSGVTWDNLPTWVAFGIEQSPSIVGPLQTVVDRPGFAGVFNIFWKDDGSDLLAQRLAKSHDDTPADAVKLHIEYSATAGGVTTTTSATLHNEIRPTSLIGDISGTLDLQINDNLDDYRHYNTTFIPNDRLVFGWVGGTFFNAAVRFPTVTIPKGATITTSYLTLTAFANNSETTVNVTFQAHDDDDSARLTNSAGWLAVVPSQLTTASSDWDNVPAFTTSTEYQSPSINAVLEEVFARSGWASGNALQLFMLDNGSTESGNPYRQTVSHDNDPGTAVKLHIEYTKSAGGVTATSSASLQRNRITNPTSLIGGGISDTLDLQIAATADDVRHRGDHQFSTTALWLGRGSVSPYSVGLRFINVAILPGSTIDTADLTFTAQSAGSGTPVLTDIYGMADPNPAQITTHTEWDTAVISLTSASSVWDNLPSWVVDVEYTTPEIKTVIQELVDDEGWASGNAMLLFVLDGGSSGSTLRTPYDYSSTPSKAVKLHVEYTTPTGGVTNTSSANITINIAIHPTSTIGNIIETLDLQIASTADDVNHRAGDHLFSTQSLLLGKGSFGAYSSAYRFTNVAIPPETAIDTADLTFTARSTQSNTSVLTDIYGMDDPDPAQITTDGEWDTAVANLTTAFEPWDNLPSWTAEVEYTTSELKTIIQELVDHGSWASGNALLLFVLDGGSSPSALRSPYDYSNTPSKVVKLHVEYTQSAGGITTTTSATLHKIIINPTSVIGGVTTTTSATLHNEIRPASIIGDISDTLDIDIAAGADDLYHISTHSLIITSAIVAWGEIALQIYDTALRFRGVTIKGTTIDVAYVRGVSDLARTNTVCRALIQAEDADDPAAIADDTDWHTRVLTGNSESWVVPPFTEGNTYDTPSLVSIFQELADRPSFGDDAVIVFIQDNSSDSNALRTFASLEHTTYDPPLLYIEYSATAGGVTTTTSADLVIGGGTTFNPVESLDAVTLTTTADLQRNRVTNPTESLDGVTSTSSANLHNQITPNESLNAVTSTTTSDLNNLIFPNESLNGVTSTTTADLHNQITPNELLDVVTSTTTADLQRNRITNPLESLDGVTSTTSANLGTEGTFNPAETLDAVTSTTTADLQRNRITNPVESLDAVTATTTADLNNLIFPSESLNAVTSTTSADLIIETLFNPAESLDAVTATTSADLNNLIFPNELLDAVTSTTTADLQRNRITNPIESLDVVTSTTTADLVTQTLFNPAESLDVITSTSIADLDNLIFPFTAINVGTSTTSAQIIQNYRPILIIPGLTNTAVSILNHTFRPITTLDAITESKNAFLDKIKQFAPRPVMTVNFNLSAPKVSKAIFSKS